MADRRLKIMHTLPDFHIGGTAKLVMQVIGALSNERYESYVCIFTQNRELKTEFEGLNVPILFMEYNGISSFFRVLSEFRKALKQHRIDVIHNNLFLDRVISSLATFGRVPIITSLHATDNPYRLPSFKRRILSFTEDIVSRSFTTRFIAVSDAVAVNAVKNRYVPPATVEVIYSGINVAEFCAGTPGRIDDPKYLISVGRLIKAKGHQDVIMAFNEIKDRYVDLKLMIVGEGGYRAQLTSLIKNHDLSDKVLLLGSRTDIPGLLAGAKLFISASYEEGFGISLIEAMASGVPVIGYRLEAFERIVTSGIDGVLVGIGDVSALAEEIVTLLEDPARYNDLSIRGKEKVSQNHNIERVIKKYEAVYESVCEARPATGRRDGAENAGKFFYL